MVDNRAVVVNPSVAVLAALAAGLLAAPRAGAEFVGGEVHAYLRAGPGLEFKILKILPEGATAQKLGAEGDWVRVRVADQDGWLPASNVTAEEPPNVALPRVREKLVSAEGKMGELEQKLSQQTAQLEELAALRERNRVLEDDASRAAATARWKTLAAGSAITLVGILIGLIAPRGSGTRSRLKL